MGVPGHPLHLYISHRHTRTDTDFSFADATMGQKIRSLEFSDIVIWNLFGVVRDALNFLT